jgi:hypothetical protein
LFPGKSTPAIRAMLQLPLSLFVLTDFANHPHNIVSADYFALVTDRLYTRAYLHLTFPNRYSCLTLI